jgi:hypothetical protein
LTKKNKVRGWIYKPRGIGQMGCNGQPKLKRMINIAHVRVVQRAQKTTKR